MHQPKIIVFAENDPKIIEAARRAETNHLIHPVFSSTTATFSPLETAATMVAKGQADGMVAGLTHTSRQVILTTKQIIGSSQKLFSSCFVMHLATGKNLILADCAVCRDPNAAQLATITLQTYQTAKKILPVEPSIALLSYSTNGSGSGESVEKMRTATQLVRLQQPNIIIAGEIQLDAAVNPAIAAKKAPNSSLRGQATVLIVPNLDAGNILYKALEQFAGAKAYGPILQGFNKPVSDLSRGSSIDDIYGTIEVLAKLIS